MLTKLIPLCALVFVANLPANDITALVQETQQVSQKPQELSFLWWLPQVFWESSFEQNPGMTEGQKSDILKRLKEYNIFAVAQSDIGTFGSFTHKEKDEIRKNIKLEIEGEEIEQLPYIVVDQEVSNLLISMKPVMAQMMGEIGKGMEFIVFPNEIAGETLLDPRSKGSFTFTSFGTEFKWRLPLGSILPPMIDEETNEEFPGNYIFNPYNGNKLTVNE